MFINLQLKSNTTLTDNRIKFEILSKSFIIIFKLKIIDANDIKCLIIKMHNILKSQYKLKGRTSKLFYLEGGGGKISLGW